MFSSLTTKIALKKAGLPSNALDFNFNWGNDEKPSRSRNTNGGGAGRNGNSARYDDDNDNDNNNWPAWMSVNNIQIPITVQPWFSPPPPPVPVAADCPKVGDIAPLDRDRKLVLGGGRRALVVFLRCVGCAFAQKTFLSLRALALKNQIRCIAVSHSSPEATQKWLDLLGGAWDVEIVVDEERALYAAWGLGLCTVWQMFNPASQVQGWKETGWLGEKVAGAIKKNGTAPTAAAANDTKERSSRLKRAATGSSLRAPASRTNTMTEAPQEQQNNLPGASLGNKWQTAGAFAVDGRGVVVWGTKASSVDDILDLEMGVKILKA